MKKVLLYLFLLSPHVAIGQSMSLLSDGKVWNCAGYIPLPTVENSTDSVSEYFRYYTVSVAGDTVVNGRKCRILIYSYQDGTSYDDAAFEEDGKIYSFVKTRNGEFEPIVMMDFGLEKGSTAPGDCYVLNVDTIEVKGCKRRRLAIGFNGLNNYVESYWVEGVGCNNDNYFMPFEKLYCEHSFMLSCYENGVCIFDGKDFDTTATAIEKMSTSKDRNGQLYDLSGKKISVPRRGQPCIDRVIGRVVVK